ncbi:uncharacterized protein EV422DRAFT_520537 [Fimicolochytrium jonesii]|uniref:uncharacterized protein n=1 Tax=Fimicolochytrium jonesii TaxID=1396493 RepID=UPI0022FF15F9|nr:uncharacterized protein EV422DRAFT_520537 [Fimicolochytrium jonesii]KAI8824564.1 hypothetical protein EV422DRAFT_520537 [Fimicolochytrium jonesii]
MAIFWQRASSDWDPALPLFDKMCIVHGPYALAYFNVFTALLISCTQTGPWVSRFNAFFLFLYVTATIWLINVPFIHYTPSRAAFSLAGPGEAALTAVAMRSVNCKWMHKAVVTVLYILGVRTIVTALWHTEDFVKGGYQVPLQLIFTQLVTLLNDDRRRTIQEKKDFVLLYQSNQNKILNKLSPRKAKGNLVRPVSILRTEKMRGANGYHHGESSRKVLSFDNHNDNNKEEVESAAVEQQDEAEKSRFESSRWKSIFVLDTLSAAKNSSKLRDIHELGSANGDTPHDAFRTRARNALKSLWSTIKVLVLHFCWQQFPASEWESKYATFSSRISQRQQQFVFLSTGVSSVLSASGEYYLTRTITPWLYHMWITVPLGCALAAAIKELPCLGPAHPRREQLSCIILGAPLEIGLAFIVVETWKLWDDNYETSTDLYGLMAPLVSVFLLHINFILSRGTLQGLRGPYSMAVLAMETCVAVGAMVFSGARYMLQLYMSAILLTAAIVAHGEAELRKHFIVNQALNPTIQSRASKCMFSHRCVAGRDDDDADGDDPAASTPPVSATLQHLMSSVVPAEWPAVAAGGGGTAVLPEIVSRDEEQGEEGREVASVGGSGEG